MKKIILILAAVATMVFAQIEHGPKFGLGFATVSGSGSGIYEQSGETGVNVKIGWNLLFPIRPYLSFHTGGDLGYRNFSKTPDDDYDYVFEIWQTEFQIPLAVRSSWSEFYVEIGGRFNLNIGSGWSYGNEDYELGSGSLDDLYNRYHLGLLMAAGMKLKQIDFSVTMAYDMMSMTKDKGDGETKNMTVDFDMIIWFGGNK